VQVTAAFARIMQHEQFSIVCGETLLNVRTARISKCTKANRHCQRVFCCPLLLHTNRDFQDAEKMPIKAAKHVINFFSYQGGISRFNNNCAHYYSSGIAI